MKRLLALVLAFMLAFSAPASATISTLQSSSIQYGNSSQTQFYVSFPVVAASDVSVVYTNATGQATTLTPSQYLVTIFPPVTGQIWSTSASVSYPLVGPAIAAGTSLTISRVLPLTQNTVLSNQSAFYPKVVEAALDTNTMELQQVSARTGQMRGSWITGTTYNFGDIVVDGINGNNTGNIYVAALSNLSTVWATDLANGDWSLALNVQGIINTNPSIANNYLFANISGSAAAPVGVAASAFLDSAFGSTQGGILYRSGSAWSFLGPGTNGQFLKTLGAAANPVWASAIGSGTVTSVATGSGVCGGTITVTGTVSLCTVANNSLLANASGGTAAPTATTLSAFLDSVLGSTQGSIIYRAGSLWAKLGPGTAGQVLTTNGAAQNPAWVGAFTASQNGYTTLPGGIILEWGYVNGQASGAAVITLPLTFPNNFWVVTLTSRTADGTATSNNYATQIDNSTFTLGNKQSANASFGWMAIGN
jgi:hypothetical protein